jgi:hypothetical protein
MRRIMRCLTASVVVVVLTGACGSDSTPGKPTATGIVDAPLAVFVRVTGETEQAAGRSVPNLEVVGYRLDNGAEVSRFELPAVFPNQLVLAGNRVVANSEQALTAYDLDGGNVHELRRINDGAFVGLAASPDGALVAVIEQSPSIYKPPAGATAIPVRDATALVVLEATTGNERLVVRQSRAEFDQYGGYLAVPTWRSDGRGVVVAGYTNTEAPGGFATVMLDGSVIVFGERSYGGVSPDGKHIGIGDIYSLCDLAYTFRGGIQITDLVTGAVVSEARSDGLGFNVAQWSPNGDELLYQTHALIPGPSNSGCSILDESSARLHILRTDGSPPIDLPDVADTFARWSSQRPVIRYCDGRPTLGIYCYDRSTGQYTSTEATVGSVHATGKELTFVGFVEPPGLP